MPKTCILVLTIFLYSFVGSFGHVQLSGGGELTAGLRGYAQHSLATSSDLNSHSEKENSLGPKVACYSVLFLLFFVCFLNSQLKDYLDEVHANAISLLTTIGMFIFLVANGTYSAVLSGQPIGEGAWACYLTCILVSLQMCFLSCVVACLCCVVAAVIQINNKMVKSMRKEYEEKVKLLSGPRQEYYESALFKSKCDAWFDKADVDGSGALDMSELQTIVVEVVGSEEVLQSVPLLAQAFDSDGNSKVEKDEFTEMMKFISVSMWQEGKCTEQQAFEILQLPETATKQEVSSAYRKMAFKWHPDKRIGVPADVAKRDCAEVNGAKATLDEKFKAEARD